MSRYALPGAVTGLSAAGIALVGGVLGVTILGLQSVFLLLALALAFVGVSVAYYCVHIA